METKPKFDLGTRVTNIFSGLTGTIDYTKLSSFGPIYGILVDGDGRIHELTELDLKRAYTDQELIGGLEWAKEEVESIFSLKCQTDATKDDTHDAYKDCHRGGYEDAIEDVIAALKIKLGKIQKENPSSTIQETY